MAKILIIDDSNTERAVISNLLNALGHQVLEACEAVEGMAKARAELPDLILMDIIMPGPNGFEATRTLKRDKATAHIPIIVISTKSLETDIVWARRQGADDYLTKPFQPKQLENSINAAIAKR